MKFARVFVVWTFALLILLAANHRSEAQISPPHPENDAGIARPQTDWLPFTRTVTITIEAGPVLTPALSSYWQTTITDFSTSDEWDQLSFAIPTDATDVTATAAGGTYQVFSDRIDFSFTAPVVNFSWNYRTNQKVLLQGNQYRLDQYASINRDRPFFYVSTAFFTSPYQYVGQIGPTPITTTTSVHWQEFVPLNASDGRHVFSSSMWLADKRAPDQLDLKITGSSVTAGTRAGTAHVTAAIQNGSLITAGAPVYINLYDRQAPSLQPAGPLDMTGGWCKLDPLMQPDCPTFNSTLGITNVLSIIGPLQVITMTADLTLTQHGWRDLWIQVDAFGSPTGLNRESNETNNSEYLGQVLNSYRVYLPAVLKGH
jgi:hypothetical protein